MTDKYQYVGVNVPPFYYTPISGTVNPNDANNCLCLCELADGRILMVWHDGSNFRGHVFSELGAVLNDNVLASSAGTIFMSGITPTNLSCFMVGSDVFFNALYLDSGNTLRNRLYIANDPADPLAGWSLRTEIDSAGGGEDKGPLNIDGAGGIPTVIGSRWCMPTPTVSSFQSHGFFRFGVWISTNHGASFTNVVDEGFYLVGGSYLYRHGGQMLVLPNGTLMVCGSGSVTGVKRAFSADDGASWWVDNPASEGGGAGTYDIQAILNNGSESFMARDTHFYTVGNDGLPITDLGAFPGDEDTGNFKAIHCPQAQALVYCHNLNRLSARAGGWLIDAIGL